MRMLGSRGRTLSRMMATCCQELVVGFTDDENDQVELEARFDAVQASLDQESLEIYRDYAALMHPDGPTATDAEDIDEIAQIFALETGRFVSPARSSCGNVPTNYVDHFPHIREPWMMRMVEEDIELRELSDLEA